jgi:hypothetical protein
MSSSDRALRRMIAQLPTMDATDFDYVIGSLEQEQRSRVLEMLKTLEGERYEAIALREVQAPFEPLPIPEDISPWLAARINGNPMAGEEVTDFFALTPKASSALREAVSELFKASHQASPAPSLLDRILKKWFNTAVINE